MMNCHFERAGKRIFPCHSHEPISSCTNKLEGDYWNTFSLFYTHASKYNLIK
jgi:hypothetical protein